VSSVIIVDDNLMLRTLLREILAAGGYTVLAEAKNGIEAEVSVQLLRPEIVTLDLVMPERGGLETLPRLLAIEPSLAIVVCSASHDQRQVVEALRLGAVGYIAKPFSQESVLTSLAEGLAWAARKQPRVLSSGSAAGFLDPSTVSEDERREFVRLEVSLPVRITPVAGRVVDTVTVDVSLGGMLLAHGQLDVGSRVMFRLSLGRTPIEGRARVVRINQGGQPAFAYERLLIADHERLTVYIAEQSAMI
jgi:two-component system, chemotaxis family, chemotaxis protein CheY